MARIDKYEPLTGGFRAKLNAAWLLADLNKVCPVSLNASGKVIKGTAGQSGFVGVLLLTQILNADDVVDVMQDGEVVELTGLAAGTQYYAPVNGDGVNTTNTLPKVGWTVEATRMVVRCNVTGDVIGTA
jgi:hypothetical protein